jgi:hypothetical protein
VLIPQGFSPGGITVRSWVLDIEGVTATDSEGRFVLANRCAGRLHVDFEEKPGAVVPGDIFSVPLAPGEVKEQVFDLRERAGCTIDVEVLANGVPVKDAMVTFESLVEPKRTAGAWRTNELGKASKWTNAIGFADAVATTDYRLPLCKIARAADLSPGARIGLVFDGACGRLSMEWPGLIVPEDEHLLYLELDDGARDYNLTIYHGPDMFAFGPVEDARRPRDNRVEFDRIAAGQYRATIEIVPKSNAPNLVYEKRLSVRPGAANELVFTKADLVKEH